MPDSEQFRNKRYLANDSHHSKNRRLGTGVILEMAPRLLRICASCLRRGGWGGEITFTLEGGGGSG